MEPIKIIKTLIDEIDPMGNLSNESNIGLAIVINDTYHKLTLGDLRKSVIQQAVEADAWICPDCGREIKDDLAMSHDYKRCHRTA